MENIPQQWKEIARAPYPAAQWLGQSSKMLEFSDQLTVKVSSSESLSPRIMPLISGYGVEVPSLQTGVSAPRHHSQSESLITTWLCVCHLKAGVFWSCPCAWSQDMGKAGAYDIKSLFCCCNRKLEYYCLFGVCSNQIRIRINTERVWKTRGNGNYLEEERQ